MDVEIEQHQSINYDNVEKNVNALNALNLNLLTAYPIEAKKEIDEAFAAGNKRQKFLRVGVPP